MLSALSSAGAGLVAFLVAFVRGRHLRRADRISHGCAAEVRDRLALNIPFGGLDKDGGLLFTRLVESVCKELFSVSQPPPQFLAAFVTAIADSISAISHPVDVQRRALLKDKTVLAFFWPTSSIARWVYEDDTKEAIVHNLALATASAMLKANPLVPLLPEMRSLLDGGKASITAAQPSASAEDDEFRVVNPLPSSRNRHS